MPAFQTIHRQRRAFRAQDRNCHLNQGTRLPLLSTSPYTFSNTIKFAAGALLGDGVSANHTPCHAGRQLFDHAVGVRQGTFHNPIQTQASHSDAEPVKLVFCGDVMVSKSGLPIQLEPELTNKMASADIAVINVESPVSLQEGRYGRNGLNFSMTKTYLAHFVDQLKQANNNLTIVYDIANNHALDGKNARVESDKTQALQQMDPDNFPLLQTVAAIKEIDSTAVIMGAHLSEPEFQSIPTANGDIIDCQTTDMPVIETKGSRYGFIGFTDLLNHNAFSWQSRVVRTEDIPDRLNQIKLTHHLDQLILVGHGNIEQCIYPQKYWRDQALSLLRAEADIIVGHGPHVPLTNELINIDGQVKLAAHSLGNFYGPSNLNNTGVNALLDYTITPGGERCFQMLPIQAYHGNNGEPWVGMIGGRPRYPHLKKRFDDLFPQNELSHFNSFHYDSDLMSALDANEHAFLEQLYELKETADHLFTEGYERKGHRVDKLYNNLSRCFNQYLEQKDKKGSYQQFKNASLAQIQNADAQLFQDKRIRNILGNILIAIVTIGTGLVVKKACTGKWSFFNHDAVAPQLKSLETTLASMSPDSPETDRIHSFHPPNG